MRDISPAAKERIKADQRRGMWWFWFWVVVVFGAWILSKLDLLDIKAHTEFIVFPGVVAIFYTLKGRCRN